MKNMKFDGIGYISGRGISKYWGVSKQISEAPGQDPWVVKFADPYIAVGKANRYRMISAKGFTLKEVDAAKIAAHFHKNPMPFSNYPAKFDIVSYDNKYVFTIDTRNKHITRASTEINKVEKAEVIQFPLTKKDFYTSPSMLEDILALDKVAEQVPPPVVEEQPQSEFDKGFAAGFALNEIIRSKLGEKGLKSVLEAVQKRLKDK